MSYFHISLWIVLARSTVITGFCLHATAKQTGRFDYREGKGLSFFRRNTPGFFFPPCFFVMFCTDNRNWEKTGSKYVRTGSGLYIQSRCQSAVGLNPVKLQSRRYIAKQTGQNLSHVKHSKLKGLLSRQH